MTMKDVDSLLQAHPNLVLLGLLVIWIGMAFAGAAIAKRKGRNALGNGLLVLAGGPIALWFVIWLDRIEHKKD